MNNQQYKFLNHIDAPKRYLSLTLDELFAALVCVVLFIFSSNKVLVALLGFGIYSSLRAIKKGEGPRALLVLAYWYLPHAFSGILLPKLPQSHHRVYLA